MLWLGLICSGVVIILLYVLFVKFSLEINSIRDVYQVSFPGIVSADLIIKEDKLVLKLKIFVWKKYYYLTDKPENNQKRAPKAEVKNSKEISFAKLWSVLKSFKIIRCELNLDLGNNQWNGILFPVFYGLESKFNRPLRINFINENSIVLKIENNLARMILAYFKN